MVTNYDSNIEQKKLNMMMMKIIYLEKQNVKNKAKSRAMMMDEIRKIIIEETNKNL